MKALGALVFGFGFVMVAGNAFGITAESSDHDRRHYSGMMKEGAQVMIGGALLFLLF